MSVPARAMTCRILDLMDEGVLDPKTLVHSLLMWMSESEVEQFAHAYELEPEQDEDDDSMIDNFNYVGSRYHY